MFNLPPGLCQSTRQTGYVLVIFDGPLGNRKVFRVDFTEFSGVVNL